jgi:hypothetical protein
MACDLLSIFLKKPSIPEGLRECDYRDQGIRSEMEKSGTERNR